MYRIKTFISMYLYYRKRQFTVVNACRNAWEIAR